MKENTELKALSSKLYEQDKEIDTLKKLLAATRATILNMEKKEKRMAEEIRRHTSDLVQIKSKLSK